MRFGLLAKPLGTFLTPGLTCINRVPRAWAQDDLAFVETGTLPGEPDMSTHYTEDFLP